MKLELTREQREEIRKWLVENRETAGDKDVLAIAAYVAQMQLEPIAEHVQEAIRRQKQDASFAAKVRDSMYYRFLAPQEPNKLVSDGKSEAVWITPARVPHKVFRRDLQSFCDEHKLDPRVMDKVGEGTERSHRGWTRHPGFGPTLLIGKPWKAPEQNVPQNKPPKRQRIVKEAYEPKTEVWSADNKK